MPIISPTSSRRHFITPLIALIGMTFAVGGVIAAPPSAPDAAAATGLRIMTSPGLKPAFNPRITDYTVRCGRSATKTTVVKVAVHAPAGTKVSVAGSVPRSGSFTATVTRAWSQSFPFVVASGGAKLGVFSVRCLPRDAPGIRVVQSRKSTAGFYIMSAHGTTDGGPVVAGGFSLHYVDIFDGHGVPLWWRKTGSVVGETKVLRNGNLAWLPSALSLEERSLDGKLVQSVKAPDAFAPDQHDFELLPNGNWLLVAYPKVSGVDLTSIGGAANTCIVDSELEEVTPAGKRVWAWYARQHVPLTDISPNARAAVSNSTCARPKDVWHLNSEQVIGGDVLLSLRRTSAIYRIRRATGAVEWRLGSTPGAHELTIVDDPLNGSIGQHDARMWSDGTVSVFDNGDDGNNPPGRRRARVVRYRIDATANTATMVQQIVDPNVSNPLGSSCCGSARMLPGGHWSIGYGAQGINTEVTASGRRVLSYNFRDPSRNAAHAHPALFSYRMDPVTGHTLTRLALRAGMDAMHPVADTQAPTVVLATNTCSVPGKNGWCRGTRSAIFDAFDDVALAKRVCCSATLVTACRIVIAANDGAFVTISSGPVCDAHQHCSAPVVAGPFKVDRTKPELTVTATTADGNTYAAGAATNQAVTLHYACSDATSGLATDCPADVTVAHPNGGSVTRTVTDNAGNVTISKVKVGR